MPRGLPVPIAAMHSMTTPGNITSNYYFELILVLGLASAVSSIKHHTSFTKGVGLLLKNTFLWKKIFLRLFFLCSFDGSFEDENLSRCLFSVTRNRFLEHRKNNPEIANLEFESHVSSKIMFCSQPSKLGQILLNDKKNDKV